MKRLLHLLGLASLLGPRACFADTAVTPATIQNALNAAKPGDVFVLPDGVYPCVTVHSRPGTQQAPITLKAAHVASAVFKGAGDGLRLQSSPWWTISGIRASGCKLGIAVLASDHVFLSHVAADHCTGHGFLSGESNDLVLDGGDFSYSVRTNSFAGSGVYIATNCQRASVSHVRVHHNEANGLQANGEGGAVLGGVYLAGITADHNGKAADGTVSGAALNILVTDRCKVRYIDLHDNYAGGIALFKSTDASILGGKIAFAPGVGRACISSKVLSSGSYDGVAFVAGKGGVMEVDGSSKLTKAGVGK